MIVLLENRFSGEPSSCPLTLACTPTRQPAPADQTARPDASEKPRRSESSDEGLLSAAVPQVGFPCPARLPRRRSILGSLPPSACAVAGADGGRCACAPRRVGTRGP